MEAILHHLGLNKNLEIMEKIWMNYQHQVVNAGFLPSTVSSLTNHPYQLLKFRGSVSWDFGGYNSIGVGRIYHPNRSKTRLTSFFFESKIPSFWFLPFGLYKGIDGIRRSTTQILGNHILSEQSPGTGFSYLQGIGPPKRSLYMELHWMSQEVRINGLFHLLRNGGYCPFKTNLFLTSWDIQVCQKKPYKCLKGNG